MRKLKAISLFIFSLIATAAFAQESVFSQFYSSALYLNPALAGVENETFLGVNYRSQWNNLSLPFNTFQASFIHPVFQGGLKKRHLGGVGASLLNDVAGPDNEFATQAFSLSAAWNIHLNEAGSHFISVAVQTGVGQQRISYDNLHWSSQYSTTAGFDGSLPGESSMTNMRVFRPILNTGLLWSYSVKGHKPMSFYNGLVLSNLPRTNSYFPGTVGDRSVIFKTHGGVTTPLSNNLEISPNYLVQVQGKNRQVNVGTYFGYSLPRGRSVTSGVKIIAGAWYRFHDGLIFSTGVSTHKINIGFSYDNNMSSMGRTFGYTGAYELSVAYRVPGKNNFKRISSPLI
ncbi:MAG TPA: PorP/SprF family type IX secretion system membrane protein [Cyclobacteriaceae bacterium]|nr:PorP/SprF family type IX secretion system membrane protein [Cyclobacteriaceae bacterium]